MATTERDYYEVLGLSRSADEREIKSAFRRLARELHPDVSDAPDADLRFKEVVEAYEVLSKPEARSLYDRFGHAGLRRGGFRPTQFDVGNLSDLLSAFFGDDLFGAVRGGRQRRRGADIAAEVEIDLVEAARGAAKEISFDVSVPCDRCGGTGAQSGTRPTTCPTCSGAGLVQEVSRTVFGEFVRQQTCPRCRGRGEVVEHPCEQCDGSGRTVETRRIEVEVPAGIHDGQRIRLSGEGHASAPGGGAAGDIYVRVRVRPDHRFTREGSDLFSTVDLTITQAALGTRVTVPTVDGDVELELEPGTQPGEVRVLRGRGMPVLQGFGRGDHRLLVNVVVPRRLGEDERRLLEELDARLGDGAYETDTGFFEKLKSAFR